MKTLLQGKLGRLVYDETRCIIRYEKTRSKSGLLEVVETADDDLEDLAAICEVFIMSEVAGSTKSLDLQDEINAAEVACGNVIYNL